jgi:hypothetical protein
MRSSNSLVNEISGVPKNLHGSFDGISNFTWIVLWVFDLSKQDSTVKAETWVTGVQNERKLSAVKMVLDVYL